MRQYQITTATFSHKVGFLLYKNGGFRRLGV
jgi:hypothetical protein